MTTRALVEADLDAVLQLLKDDEERLNGCPSRLQPQDLGSWLSRVDFAHDTRVCEQDGTLHAVAWTDVVPDGETVVGLAIVHPDAKGRGLGTELLAWCEERARTHDARRLQQIALGRDAAAAALFRAHGLREVRRFYEMAIELQERPAVPDVPVETFREEEAHAFHDALDESFQDHWEHHGRPFEDWWETHKQSPNFDPSLWFLVRDGDEIAAVARNEANRNGGGYVGALGVRRRWRGKGYAKALLLHTFAEFWNRGTTRVTLGVDAENPTGATHLYERVGMHVEQENVVFEKEIA